MRSCASDICFQAADRNVIKQESVHLSVDSSKRLDQSPRMTNGRLVLKNIPFDEQEAPKGPGSERLKEKFLQLC